MSHARFHVLDGWRGISILFVLAGHLLPIGPSNWQMNGTVAATGMALFFVLSGFLITHILMKNYDLKSFVIRRFMRIVPLAWLVIIIKLSLVPVSTSTLFSHLFFYANWKPITLTAGTGHFWSLCVEMQFYLLIAVLVLLLKSRAFLLLPVISLAVTGYRYLNGVEMAITTYYRLDEILAGCTLALLYQQRNYKAIADFFKTINPLYILPFLLVSAHPQSGLFNYIRPYLAMLVVGSTLFNQERNVWWNKLLNSRVLFYLASISYALYVIHGVLTYTWLGEGDTVVKYLKRPLLLASTFLLSHISTFYYEKYWIGLAKRFTRSGRIAVNYSK